MFLDRLREVVERQPDRVAIEDGDRQVTFRELDLCARALAAELAERGIGREDVVALGLRKSAEYLIGLLATWYAGAAFLPLDPTLPGARLQFMLEDAGARLVLTRGSDAAPLRHLNGLELLLLNDDLRSREGDRGGSAAGSVHDLAYVIYTSGSTGAPKGVMITHRGIVNLIDGQIPAFGQRSGSRVLWLLSTSFDASVSDIGTALLGGATLCIEPGSAIETAAGLLRTVERRKITHLDLPPALLAMLDPADAPDCLETLIIGGEPCPPDVVRRWARRCRVVNVYGPTEATVCSSLCLCDPETWSRPLLGQPLPGVCYQALDSELRPTPAGVAGELYIGGRGLARGYVRRPELDADRFVQIDGERWYRTGDRVVRHPDGEYEFLGRVDRQVKLRGQLVSPEEVECRILEHPSVAQAAVVKRKLGPSEALVAFVVPGDRWGDGAAGSLRAHLGTQLPAWMQPQRIECLESLPVTSTGKTDYAALTGLVLNDTAAVECVAPRDEREAALLAVWQSVLERSDFGVTDDFFSLGGDSLAVLRVVAAAEARGIPCPPGLLMNCRTVRGIIEGTASGNSGLDEGMSAASLRQEVERYRSELARLAPESRENAENHGDCTARSGTQRVLLTGATGFLGSRLLVELLQYTCAEIVCIVRAETSQAGLERCVRAVETHGLPLTSAARERLRIVCGDLAQPRLGLDEDEWVRLTRSIDAVYHSAAWVHLVHPFEALKDTNLGGTAEVLRLVKTGRPKQLHYVSTLSVFVATDRNTGWMREDDDLSETGVVYGGYGQSKWAAEVLVRQCTCPSEPVSVYRLGLITGDTETGYAPRHDQLGLFLRGMAELGCFPGELSERLRVDITPADYAAKALVQLSLGETRAEGVKTFHVASPRGATLGELVDAVRRAGVALEAASACEWRMRVRGLDRDGLAEAASTAFVSLCRGLGDGTRFKRQRTLDLFQATDTRFEMTNTSAALEGSGLQCPEASPDLLDLYVQRALGIGERR